MNQQEKRQAEKLKISNTNINAAAFGKKVPLAEIKLKDKEKNKFVPARIYELDCTDTSDIDEVMKADGKWAFKASIIRNMNAKYSVRRISNGNYGPTSILGERTSGEYNVANNRFYVTQLKDGSTVGMTQVHNRNSSLCIDFIESREDKRYKYVGQTLLAALGMDLLKHDGKRILITAPTDSAVPFYVDKCGFQESINSQLKMNKKNIKKFIRRTQKHINSPILDIRA